MMSIVADIRRVMLDKGISQAELGRTLGMSPSQLSSILRDEEYNFTVKMLRRFAAALDTELTIRVGESVPEVPENMPMVPVTFSSGKAITYTLDMDKVDPDIVHLLTGERVHSRH